MPAGKRSYSEALDELKSAQKTSAGAPPYTRFISRPAGRRFAAAAYQLGLTPNKVTLISAVFTFIGIALIAVVPPTPLLGVLIFAALATGYSLDSADGQLARLTKGGSTAGEWLDHVIDCIKLSTVHLAVLIAVYRHFDVPGEYLLVPIGFQVVATVMFFTMILNDLLCRLRNARRSLVGERQSAVRTALVAPMDYGFLCLAFLTFGFSQVFPVLYALLFLINAAYLTLALGKWFRDMSAIDHPASRQAADVAT